MPQIISHNTNRDNLLQLFFLRIVALLGQIVTILLTYKILNIELPLKEMCLVLVFLFAVTMHSFYRYKANKYISDRSLFFELLLDVLMFTIQIYLSGGTSNPFISLYLLQVIIAAILLKQIYAWQIAIITVFCYIILNFYYHEIHLFHHHGNHGGNDLFSLHLQGMLISYVLAAFLLMVFVTKIIKNNQERDKQINLLKQRASEKEQIVQMGLLATGAAHELSTPLTTMAVITNDWKKLKLDNEILEDIELVEREITRCKKIISNILSFSGRERLEEAKSKSLKEAFEDIISEWSKSRNPHNLEIKISDAMLENVVFDNAIIQIFLNIFDNALEASPDFIAINAEVKEGIFVVTVIDQGKGFSGEILQEIGSPTLPNKNNNGVGLFLVTNILDSVGGTLEINNLNQGAKVTVNIPLESL